MRDCQMTVRKNETFGQYGHLTLTGAGPLVVAPGQFAMLRPAGATEPPLRRAMAVYRVVQEKDSGQTAVEFIYQVFGRGTENLRRLRPGDVADCLLPLGKPFDDAPVAVAGREALLAAGGVGAAALFLLAQSLRRQSVSVRLFLGGRSTMDLIGLNDFIELGCAVHVATNDGSRGVRGHVTEPLETFLADHAEETRAGKYVVYACGPTPMLRRVTEIAAAANVLAFASLEERMACGFGVCVGCVVETQGAGAETEFQRVCVEGPVFRCDRLVW
jgi:dihydroorotate dehydrogenase electron transfer subunit